MYAIQTDQKAQAKFDNSKCVCKIVFNFLIKICSYGVYHVLYLLTFNL